MISGALHGVSQWHKRKHKRKHKRAGDDVAMAVAGSGCWF